jgi:uncharacterized surface protein with fasciclin (FAS1) repeats
LLLRWSTEAEQLVLFDNTRLTTPDILVSNGVLHVIDGLLLPQDVTANLN